jgi:hypothetical protein
VVPRVVSLLPVAGVVLSMCSSVAEASDEIFFAPAAVRPNATQRPIEQVESIAERLVFELSDTVDGEVIVQRERDAREASSRQCSRKERQYFLRRRSGAIGTFLIAACSEYAVCVLFFDLTTGREDGFERRTGETAGPRLRIQPPGNVQERDDAKEQSDIDLEERFHVAAVRRTSTNGLTLSLSMMLLEQDDVTRVRSPKSCRARPRLARIRRRDHSLTRNDAPESTHTL